MIQASVLKCKCELETFTMEKMGNLLGRESEQLGNIINQTMRFYKENIEDYEKILLTERRRRL